MQADELSDEEAIERSKDDGARFTVIFDHHVAGIHRYLVLRAGVEFAEELTSETFVLAFRGRSSYEPERGPVRGWLYGIAGNVARHHHRRAGRKLRALARIPSAQAPVQSEPLASLHDRARLKAALQGLDPSWRELVFLIGVLDLSYEEASVALGIPVGTVRSRYARARKRLQTSLAEDEMPSIGGKCRD
ncbi:MAG: RNA polymerase sigma factor [Acidimicrobiales bacterium]